MYSIFKRSTAITFKIIYYMSKYYHNYLHKQPSKVGCFILVYLDRFLRIVCCVFKTQKHLSYHRTIVLIECVNIHICIFLTSVATIVTFKTPVSYQIIQYIVKMFKISISLLFQQIFTEKSYGLFCWSFSG